MFEKTEHIELKQEIPIRNRGIKVPPLTEGVMLRHKTKTYRVIKCRRKHNEWIIYIQGSIGVIAYDLPELISKFKFYLEDQS